MKTDGKLWLAILVLIGLVIWLIALSLQRPNPQNVNKALEQLQEIKHQIDTLPKPTQTIVKTVQEVPGLQGPQGSPGKDGKNGTNGKNGINGKDGQSVYQLWLSLGNTGTPADFLNSLKGQNGTNGNEIELRCNPDRSENEWRYKSDLQWHLLDKVTSCL